MDVDSVLEGVTKEDVLHSHIIMMEYQNRALMAQGSARMGHTVHRMCNIVDMTGASSRLASRKAMDIFKLIAAVDQDNYPETMGATYVVNAPWVFTAVWAVVSPMLGARTQRKVQVFGDSGYTARLLEYIAPESLPTFLGGVDVDDRMPLVPARTNDALSFGIPGDVFADCNNPTHRAIAWDKRKFGPRIAGIFEPLVNTSVYCQLCTCADA
jgi:hypothetical protein